MFTDSVQGNLDLIKEIINDAPPSAKANAKTAAVRLEQTFNAILKDSPRDPGTRIGLTFAVYMMAQRLVEQEQAGGEQQLIKLLS